jgi:uncharacterized RDD family membrane protein YckC
LEGFLPAVKCPQCGFVSYGLDQCKKCHYPFADSAAKGSSPLHDSSSVKEFDHEFTAPAEPPLISELEPGPLQSLPFNSQSSPERERASGPNWREELSDRLVSFRKRRGIAPPEKTPLENLKLEFGSFEPEEELESPSHDRMQSNLEGSEFDLEMGSPDGADTQNQLTLERPQLQPPGQELHLDADPAEIDDDMTLGELEKSPPMEIHVNSPEAGATADDLETVGHFYAPLQRRFMAGLADAALLLASAAVFGGIFWYSMTRFCDHNTLATFSLVIIGLMAFVVIFSYFAIFTALSFATPGMLFAGCEVRNLRGEHPTVNEALWRAFGVLVSMSALMVGFIWAYVDSETLTWHDRMSGTVITDALHAPPRAKASPVS